MVDFDRYKRSVSRMFRRGAGACLTHIPALSLWGETRSHSRQLVMCGGFFSKTDSGDGTTAYGGTIIDAKTVRSDGLTPWEWLKVEWDNGGEDMTQVSPW